jgi:hypothetical protein
MSNVAEAIQIAVELDQLRQIYGEDCVSFVSRALRHSTTSDWQETITGAVTAYVEQSRVERFVA